MTTATERKNAAQAYVSSGSVYRVDEVMARLGLSKTWIRKAKTKGLTFSKVSDRGNEVVDGEELKAFLAAHPDLLSEAD